MSQSAALPITSAAPPTVATLRWRNALFVLFALAGVMAATWLSRNPAIRDLLHAGDAQMGWLVFGIAAGSIVGLTCSSHVLARVGARVTVSGCLVLVAGGMIFAGFAASELGSVPLVIAGLAVFGLGAGLSDVAINVEGASSERVLGRTVMPLYHAAFSAGTVVGAVLGALVEHVGVPVAAHVATVGTVVLIVGLRAVRYLPAHLDQEGPTPPDPVDENTQSSWRGRLSIWRERRTLLIGLVVLGMAFAEGSANDWLALAMVDGHGVSHSAAAVTYGLFVGSMTIGRVLGVRLLDRFGRVPVLRGSALLAVVGLAVVIFAPSAWLAAIGVLAWGLGAALGFPVGMSAAADDPKAAAARVSAVATIGYCAFLVGPPALGFLGEHFGLLRAFILVLALVVLAGLASGATGKAARR